MKDPVDLLFEAAHRHPDHPAVEDGARITSYAELADLVRRLAAAIAAAVPADRERRVLVRLPRNAEAYAAMFAALHAGGYYSPVNLDHPADLQRRQLHRFAPSVIVGAVSDIDPPGVPVIDPSESLPQERLAEPAAAHDLAYVMFTSGSTGEPKGVMVGREALTHYTDWARSEIAAGPQDRWSQHPNLGFDLSVLDVYGALCSGATLVPLNDRRDRLVPASAIRKLGLTIWNSVPSVVDLMRRGGKMTGETLSSLRLMTFCGEPLLREHLDAIFAARPDLTVYNTYGPTEATVSMTLLRLDADTYRDHCRENVAIGDPIPGMHILLEDGPDSDEGEIVIAGPQVARGYWQDPALTADRFVSRQIAGQTLAAYRTGDWVARRGPDIYFTSRIDRQIKINGYRLELSAVEAALRDAGAIAACVVFHDGRLVGFVESADGNVEALRNGMTGTLPAYAIPQEIRVLDRLPRNANDKIDAGALLSRMQSE